MIATVPPVNVVLGEDVTVEIKNTVVPLCPQISASTVADNGSGEEDGDGETFTNGK